MAWGVSRTSGRGGIRLDGQERYGWYYALTGLNAFDVLLYTVVTALRTPIADPEPVGTWPRIWSVTGACPITSSGRSGTARGRCG
ncbi:hypothetical protein [Streptomyces sp. RP5T]|uniref:hypothetical protein n=1 Tax=Streptomyces sp. RP5T TaxID=2490848 RepID=UPI000F64C02D|nr:hypothetical protein [Streptomyces sp. RP5T]RRR82646.1 hypothetical protein EHS43_16300 [Streptomyces sp. RP5T]